MPTAFRGVFLTAHDPEATAAFYRDIAGLPMEAMVEGEYTYWKTDCNGIQLAVHDAEGFADYAHPPNPASNLTHLYFKIDDRAAFLTRLETTGNVPLTTDDVVVTVIDPDGRHVMFGTA